MRALIAAVLCAAVTAGAEEAPPVPTPLAAKACAALLGALPDVERCWWHASALGGATVVNVERARAGAFDHAVWLIDGSHPARPLPQDLGWGGAVVLPSRTEAIADDHGRWLVRVDLRAARLRPGRVFARCTEPALSPSGKWIVCRDPEGDVLKVPVRGGRLRVVWRPDGPHERDGHGPVSFPHADRMEVGINETGDSGTVVTVPWRE